MKKIRVIPFILSLLGMLSLVLSILLNSPFYERYSIPAILSTAGLILVILSFASGVIICIISKLKGTKTSEKDYFCVAGIIIPIFFLLLLYWIPLSFWLINLTGRFKDYDAAKFVSIIKENYDFELPDRMDSPKAAKGAIYGFQDDTYVYLFKFDTNPEGWEQFSKSIVSTLSYGDDWTIEDSFWDWNEDSDGPKTCSKGMGAPKWYRKKIIKGKEFIGQIPGKDFLIDDMYVDLSENDVITIYMVILQDM